MAPKAKAKAKDKGVKKDSAPGWKQVDSVYVRDYGSPSAAQVAGFDMDSTLINTKSGKTFPENKDDWVFWSPEVVPKLQELHKKGTKVVIITNQGGVSKGKTKLTDIQSKIDAIQGQASVPIVAMILTEEDIYRKPLPSCWKLLETQFNSGKAIVKAKSTYCGDAAGREPPVVKKKDFSANDLKFALNVGVPFQTPEEFFQGKAQTYEKEKFDFDPRKLGVSPAKFPVPPPKSPTVYVCVGPPGSGKSTAATAYLTMCQRANQDTLKTKEKCQKAVEEALKAGKSAIIDNQNKSKGDRAPYIALAKKYGAEAIAIYYKVPKELCFHLNAYRLLNTESELHRADKVPAMIIHSFYKGVEEPKTAEGFKWVYQIGLEHFAVNQKDANLDLLRSFLE